MLLLRPVNPRKRVKHLVFSGLMSATSGGITLATLADVVVHVVPRESVERFPAHENYIAAAFAISLLTTLLLVLVPKVIALSLSQTGNLLSLLYLAFSLAGVFIGFHETVFIILYGLAVLVVVVVLGQSVHYAYTDGSRWDVIIGLVMLAVALAAASAPALSFLGVWT